MIKKCLLLIFVLLLSISFAIAVDLDYTAGVVSTGGYTAYTGYSINNINNGVFGADGSIDSSKGFFCDQTGCDAPYTFNITFDKVYNITQIGFRNYWDGAGSAFPRDYELYVGSTLVYTDRYDGLAGISLNYTLPTGIESDYIMFKQLNFGTRDDTYFDEFFAYGFADDALNFSVSAISDYNNDSINSFSIDIGGVIYNTTNGTITTNILSNSSNLYNITFFDDDWYNRTYSNFNVSSDLIGELNQTDIKFNFYFSSGDLISTPINVTDLNNSVFFNVSGGQLNFSPVAENITFEVSCNNSVFAPFNITIPFTALQNESFNFTVNETPTYITFLDGESGNPVDNANITVVFPSSFKLYLMTDSNGTINFSYIQNNITEFGNYTFIFNKLGYVAINISDTINESNIPFNATYNISRAKLTINVFDRVTGLLLDGVNVSIAFIGLFNETTNNGTLIKDNLTIVGGDYLVYASADGYKTSVRGLTFTNQEEFTLNFYLLNLSLSNAGTLFVTTKDSFFRKVTGAKVELLEYIPSSLSYISVDECVSNIDAQCSFAIELNTKVYYIKGTSIIGGSVLVAETNQNGEIFTVNNDNRDLIFYTRTEFDVSSDSNLIYSIDETFINNVSSISVEFSTFDGTAETVCIEYFKRVGTTYISVTGSTYCLQASSALQNIDASVTLNRSNDYEARIYIDKTVGDINLKTFSYPSRTGNDEIFSDDIKGAIVMILWVFALAFSLHSKNISMWFVFAILLSWAEILIFPLYSIVSISVFKTIISLFTLMIARKKQDFT